MHWLKACCTHFMTGCLKLILPLAEVTGHELKTLQPHKPCKLLQSHSSDGQAALLLSHITHVKGPSCSSRANTPKGDQGIHENRTASLGHFLLKKAPEPHSLRLLPTLRCCYLKAGQSCHMNLPVIIFHSYEASR